MINKWHVNETGMIFVQTQIQNAFKNKKRPNM